MTVSDNLAEFDGVIDMLTRHPSTAAHIELARQMGSAMPQLYHPAGSKEKPPQRPALESARELYGGLRNALSPGTRKALPLWVFLATQ